MAIYQLPNELGYNFSDGLDQYLLYLNSQVPNLFSYIFTLIYIIIMLGGYMAQKKTEGRNDFSLWMLIAGVVTVPAALILSLITGLIPLAMVMILVALTILAAVMYFSQSSF